MNPLLYPNNMPHCFLCDTAEHTQGNNPHDAFGSGPCRLSVGRIFLVCTKYCRMPHLSPFSRLNALNLICFATLDWYLPKHNSAWKLVLQENAPSGPLAFRRWSLVQHKVWKKTCIWNRKSVSFLRFLGGWVTRVAVWAGIPRLPSPSSLLQLYQGHPEVFPGQPRDIVPPASPGFSSRPPLGGTCPEQTDK